MPVGGSPGPGSMGPGPGRSARVGPISNMSHVKEYAHLEDALVSTPPADYGLLETQPAPGREANEITHLVVGVPDRVHFTEVPGAPAPCQVRLLSPQFDDGTGHYLLTGTVAEVLRFGQDPRSRDPRIVAKITAPAYKVETEPLAEELHTFYVSLGDLEVLGR